MSWFWRTLSGYTATFVDIDKEWTVKHRPFRKPLMSSTKHSGLRGKNLTAIYFDEWVAPQHDAGSDL